MKSINIFLVDYTEASPLITLNSPQKKMLYIDRMALITFAKHKIFQCPARKLFEDIRYSRNSYIELKKKKNSSMKQSTSVAQLYWIAILLNPK